MAKIILVLVLAIVAVQGLEVESVGQPRSISDLINVLKEVQKAIDDAVNTIKQKGQEIITKIQDILKNTDVVAKIEKVAMDTMNKIASILAKKGIDVNFIIQCVEAEKSDVEQLVKSGADAVKGCADAAFNATTDVRTKMEKLVNDSIKTERDVVGRVLKCAENNRINPIGLALCLNKQMSAINTEVTALVNEAKQLKTEVDTLLPPVGKQLEECLKAACGPIKAQGEAIVNKFEQCIVSHLPTTAAA